MRPISKSEPSSSDFLSHGSEIGRPEPISVLIVRQMDPIPSRKKSEPSIKVGTGLRSSSQISVNFEKSQVNFLTFEYRTTFVQMSDLNIGLASYMCTCNFSYE